MAQSCKAESKVEIGLEAGPDLHLIFPPQWSPFQPFLSTPSLKAYLQSQGHRVRQDDWNVVFYRWFLSPERLPRARARLLRYAQSLSEADTVYRAKCLLAMAVLDDHARLHALVETLRGGNAADELGEFKEAVDALRALLSAFSVAEPVIEVARRR
jgi:hypothetical protein